MDDETLACYISSEEEAGQQPRRTSCQPGNASSQLAPGWLNPSPGSQAVQKKEEKAYSAWTMTRPSSSGISHTPAHRRTMTSTASAMAVAQSLAKAAESAALATKRAADTIQEAGTRLAKQGAPPEDVARHLVPATGETATSAGGEGGRGRGRGRRGGRGGQRGRGSDVLRSDSDLPTAILPASGTPPPKMTRAQRQAKEEEDQAEDELNDPYLDELNAPLDDEDDEDELLDDMDVSTEEYEEEADVKDDACAGMAQATNSSAFPSSSSSASADELAVAAAKHALQQEIARQAEAKAKAKAKAKGKKKAEEQAEKPPPKKKGTGEG